MHHSHRNTFSTFLHQQYKEAQNVNLPAKQKFRTNVLPLLQCPSLNLNRNDPVEHVYNGTDVLSHSFSYTHTHTLFADRSHPHLRTI